MWLLNLKCWLYIYQTSLWFRITQFILLCVKNPHSLPFSVVTVFQHAHTHIQYSIFMYHGLAGSLRFASWGCALISFKFYGRYLLFATKTSWHPNSSTGSSSFAGTVYLQRSSFTSWHPGSRTGSFSSGTLYLLLSLLKTILVSCSTVVARVALVLVVCIYRGAHSKLAEIRVVVPDSVVLVQAMLVPSYFSCDIYT